MSWFGTSEGLDINTYKKINYVDGYKIILKNNKRRNLTFKFLNEKNVKKNLWVVNIGGY